MNRKEMKYAHLQLSQKQWNQNSSTIYNIIWQTLPKTDEMYVRISDIHATYLFHPTTWYTIFWADISLKPGLTGELSKHMVFSKLLKGLRPSWEFCRDNADGPTKRGPEATLVHKFWCLFCVAIGFCVATSVCPDPQNGVLWLLLGVFCRT